MTRNFVSIGDNLQRGLRVRRTLGELRARGGKVRVSKVYETPFVGFSGDPFLNLVAGFDTDLQAEEWVGALRDVEAGNDLQCAQVRDWPHGIFACGDMIRDEGPIGLPGKEITRQACELLPQDERGSNLRQPVPAKCYADMCIRLNFDVTGMQPIESSPGPGQ